MRLKLQDAIDTLTILEDNTFKADTSTLYQNKERHLAGKTCSPTDSGCNDTNLFEKLLLEKRVPGESLQIILLELGPIGKCFPYSGRQTLGGNNSYSRSARLHLKLATEFRIVFHMVLGLQVWRYKYEWASQFIPSLGQVVWSRIRFHVWSSWVDCVESVKARISGCGRGHRCGISYLVQFQEPNRACPRKRQYVCV